MGTAGAFDSQFGASVPRNVPTWFTVILTSGYSTSTGYSWMELRAMPGAGYAVPSLPLTGDQAYAPTNDTTLTAGTLCYMWIDRDQTTYGIMPFIGTGSGSGGSGSGSGGSCENPVEPITLECSQGQRTATINSLAPVVVGNTVELQVCGTTSVPLGPCGGPHNFYGVPQTYVVNVCIQYSDPVAPTANNTISPSSQYVYPDATSANVDSKLPAWEPGHQFLIKRRDASGVHTATLSATGTDTINGSLVSLPLPGQHSGYLVTSDSAAGNWVASPLGFLDGGGP